jgi:hypothetical protein
MDIIDRNRIRNHPAAVLARRAAERRQAKPAPVQPKAPTTRAELEAAIAAAWSQACPHDNLQDALMSRFGCNDLRFLSLDLLEAVLAAITK